MRVVIGVELAVAFLAGVAFVALYATRSRWRDTSMGRHMMAVSVVMAGEAGVLLAALLGLEVPLWLFAFGFGVLDVLLVQRLVLLLRVQRHKA